MEIALAQHAEALLQQVKELKPKKSKQWVEKEKPLKESYERVPHGSMQGQRNLWCSKRGSSARRATWSGVEKAL